MKARDSQGRTALILSAIWTNLECMEKFFELGADVNISCSEGNTSLMDAVTSNFSPKLQSVKCVKLLKAGATVNKVNNKGLNALQSHLVITSTPNKKVILALFVAGESFTAAPVNITEEHLNLFICVTLKYLLGTEVELSLKNLCRETIRKHLINMDPHLNLLVRKPKLSLKSELTSYLLYDIFKSTCNIIQT